RSGMMRRVGALFLIRHGQASYGEVDYDRLSTRGEEQARHVGTWLRASKIDQLYAGPMKRQQQTAAAANIDFETLPDLAEYPAFEMLQHLVPKLVAEDAKFAALTTAPTPRLLDEAFH